MCPVPLTGKDASGTSQNLSTTLDAAGSCQANVAPGISVSTLSPWTVGQALNSTQLIMSSGGWAAALVQLVQTGTFSGGAVTFEGTYNGTFTDGLAGAAIPIPVAQLLNASTLAPLTNPYTLVTTTNQPYLILNQGYQQVRVKLSTVITGSSAPTVTPYVNLLPYNPAIGGILNPLAANPPSTVIGGVAISQASLGASNAVQSIAGITGGATPSSAIAPATPAGVNLKASAGMLFGIQATTIQATPVYVKFYDSASAPTCGMGAPILRWMVPSASTAANGAGTNVPLPSVGINFASGIGYCVTGALADNDTTPITAANTLVNIQWK